MYLAVPVLSCFWVGREMHPYFTTLEKLVKALHILMNDHLAINDLIVAKRLLSEFGKEYEAQYGRDAVVMNVHLLRYMLIILVCYCV